MGIAHAPSDAASGTLDPDAASGIWDRDAASGIFDRLFGMLRRLVPSDGLSLTTGSTLHRLDRHGAARLSDLAAREGVTQPAMSQLVSRLERDGLASRETDPADGRVVLVQITRAGRDLLARRREARAQRLAELVAGLSAEERATLAAALPVLDKLSDLLPNS
jgi:DNA-binding MarR family transcriptional regulator